MTARKEGASQQILTNREIQRQISFASNSFASQDMLTEPDRFHVATTRNRFVHQQLAFRNGTDAVNVEWALYKTRASKKGVSAEFCATGPEEVAQLNGSIAELTTDLFRLVDAMIKEDLLPITVHYRLVKVEKNEPPPWQHP